MYYQNEPSIWFILYGVYEVYSIDNLPNKIKNGAYAINPDEYSDIRTHWVELYINTKTATYFDSFRVEHMPNEIKKFIKRNVKIKDIIENIFMIQAYDSIMCGYFCIGFIDFMFKDNRLTDFANIFSPNDLKKNDDIFLNYFLSNFRCDTMRFH